MAFAYDPYTNPSKNNGVLRATLTEQARTAFENASMLSPQWARPKAMLVALARKMGCTQIVIDNLQADYRRTKQETEKQR